MPVMRYEETLLYAKMSKGARVGEVNGCVEAGVIFYTNIRLNPSSLTQLGCGFVS